MSSPVSVKSALRKGSFIVNYPVMTMLVLSGGLFFPLLNKHTDHSIGMIMLEFMISLFFIWLYWSLANTRWRIWAFEHVRNVHELKRKAIEANLYFNNTSFYSSILWIRPSDQQKIEQLKEKFNYEDEFIDQKNIPAETIIYNSKIRTTFVFISLLFGVFLGLALFFTAHPFIGIMMSLFAGFFGLSKYKELKKNTPQIILNEKGIETCLTKFKKWSSIDHEKVTIEGSGNHFMHFLEYTYPGGREKLNINYLSIEPSQLENLLYVYRGRSKPKSTSEPSEISKEELMNKFFNQ